MVLMSGGSGSPNFSKIIGPGMRMGWVCAAQEIMEQIVTAKQGTDLHSNILRQRIIVRFLAACPIDEPIRTITDAYAHQRDCMLAAIKE